MKKLYTILKHVYAESIKEAYKLDKEEKPLEIYIDNRWKEANMLIAEQDENKSNIGFNNNIYGRKRSSKKEAKKK